eukprot:jgi/Undpi1/3316/HiC_scaffold_15.g06690.m1
MGGLGFGQASKVSTSLQACLEQILLCGGDNIYKLPHLRKDAAARGGTPIPRRYPVSEEAWLKGRAALAALQRQGAAAGGHGGAAGGRGAASGRGGAAAGGRGAASRRLGGAAARQGGGAAGVQGTAAV